MSAHKISDGLDREDMLKKIGKLHRFGLSQQKIAEQVGLSQPMVGRYIEKIRERYNTSAIANREALVQEKLAQYQELREEAFEAWQRSQTGLRLKVAEGELTPEKAEVQRRAGNVEFLRLIRDTYADERAMLGLDEAIKFEGKVETFWDMIAQEMSRPINDPLEEAVKALPLKVLGKASQSGPDSPTVLGKPNGKNGSTKKPAMLVDEDDLMSESDYSMEGLPDEVPPDLAHGEPDDEDEDELDDPLDPPLNGAPR